MGGSGGIPRELFLAAIAAVWVAVLLLFLMRLHWRVPRGVRPRQVYLSDLVFGVPIAGLLQAAAMFLLPGGLTAKEFAGLLFLLTCALLLGGLLGAWIANGLGVEGVFRRLSNVLAGMMLLPMTVAAGAGLFFVHGFLLGRLAPPRGVSGTMIFSATVGGSLLILCYYWLLWRLAVHANRRLRGRLPGAAEEAPRSDDSDAGESSRDPRA